MEVSKITNPIIPGFNPDPSILRVGDDYYIANSTFEWLPGVPIHHSRDLLHWNLIGHALTGKSSPNVHGVENSSGIWAPSLSYSDGKYWLIYTEVRTRVGPFKDVKNFLVTAQNILGPWSEPVFLNSSGFDPSLFHDEIANGGDGRKWLVNMRWDHRLDHPSFDGIIVQEFDPVHNRLVGPITNILRKPGLIEGPNLYRHNGRVYLMLAEGGTGWNHGISMARSDYVTGHYEVDPIGSLMTSRGEDGKGDESIALQKAGHGELVETRAGGWFLAHLASRPLGTGDNRRCTLGRETCLQSVTWTDDGWLRLSDGSTRPSLEVTAPPELMRVIWPDLPVQDHFNGQELSPHWSSLRTSFDSSWLSLAIRPGYLRLYGRESIHSYFDQSLIAKRQQSFTVMAETAVECCPSNSDQLCGLICWYDTKTHYYLRITSENDKKTVGVVLTDDGVYRELNDTKIEIDDWQRTYLRAEINHEFLEFFVSKDGIDWRKVGATLDATKLSDDYGHGLHFTGAMIGICAQDMGGTGFFADYDYFTLKNSDY